MKGSAFATLPLQKKKKMMKDAARGANRDQRELMKRFRIFLRKNGNPN